jgi:hypothetical protein
MKPILSFFILILFFSLSCTDQEENISSDNIISDLSTLLEKKGYEIILIDNHSLRVASVPRDYNMSEMILTLNKFYEGKGFPGIFSEEGPFNEKPNKLKANLREAEYCQRTDTDCCFTYICREGEDVTYIHTYCIPGCKEVE